MKEPDKRGIVSFITPDLQCQLRNIHIEPKRASSDHEGSDSRQAWGSPNPQHLSTRMPPNLSKKTPQ